MKHYDTVLVTGASRGLGLSLADELIGKGYAVVMVARSEQELHAVAKRLRFKTHAARVSTVIADLSIASEVERCAREAQQAFGSIDVLINNAGIGSYKPLVEWSHDEVSQCMAVNLTAPMLLSKVLLPGMLARRKGMIVNIASDLSRRYLANMSPYVASKWGLLGFAGSLLREVKSHGIKVTTVMPGIIDTYFNGAKQGDKDESWALQPAELSRHIVELIELPESVVVDELTIHPLHQDF